MFLKCVLQLKSCNRCVFELVDCGLETLIFSCVCALVHCVRCVHVLVVCWLVVDCVWIAFGLRCGMCVLGRPTHSFSTLTLCTRWPGTTVRKCSLSAACVFWCRCVGYACALVHCVRRVHVLVVCWLVVACVWIALWHVCAWPQHSLLFHSHPMHAMAGDDRS